MDQGYICPFLNSHLKYSCTGAGGTLMYNLVVAQQCYNAKLKNYHYSIDGARLVYKISATTAANLIQQHRDELISYLIQRNHSPELAADILQDAYIRLVNANPSSEIKNPRAFLYKIVSHLAIDYHRSLNRQQARQADESELNNVSDSSPTLEHQLYTQEQLACLKQAVSELPPKCRQVFIMHKFRHYPYSKISQELNISESTILKHMVKAMKHCRQRMTEFNSE